MDRHTLAQAVAMLVILSLLVRWLPAPAVKPREQAQLDALGRGEPWQLLAMDRQSLDEGFGNDHVLARMRGRVTGSPIDERFEQTLGLVREIQAQSEPGQVVQLRGYWRNELYLFTYYLYPLRVLGLPREDGDPPPRPEAQWVLRAGDPALKSRRAAIDPAVLERRP